jgi:hypothetical protein
LTQEIGKAGRCRKLDIENTQNLYFSPITIRLVKSRKRWARYVARTRQMRNTYNILSKKLKERVHLGDTEVNERIMSKCSLS